MTKNEIEVLRANLLGGMNAYVLDVIGDDDITDFWFTYGVPDGADEEMLMELADDEENFADICGVFYKCLRANLENE